MRFAIGVIFRKDAKHRLHAVAAFQPPRPADRRAVRDHRVVLHIRREPHDVVPFQPAEFGQMSLVEQGVIGKQPCNVKAGTGIYKVGHCLSREQIIGLPARL